MLLMMLWLGMLLNNQEERFWLELNMIICDYKHRRVLKHSVQVSLRAQIAA